MKRFYVLFLVTAMLLCGCAYQKEKPEGKKWDCSVVVPVEDPTYIAYSSELLETDSGELSFQNRNPFPVWLYLYQEDAEKLVVEETMMPGGVFVFLRVEEGKTYTVGFHADQPEGTRVNIMAYDGNHPQEPYSLNDE